MHKRTIFIIVVSIVVLLGGSFYFIDRSLTFDESTEDPIVVADDVSGPESEDGADEAELIREPEVVVEGLSIPWDIAFLPEGGMLVTERGGRMIHIGENGVQSAVSVPSVTARGEGGLLGLELHPDFSKNNYVYIYRTATMGGSSINEVVRYRYENREFFDETIVLGDIEGALFHNGGRLRFGPDGYLYVATGDAQDGDVAQDIHSLAGKILRISTTGSFPEDNPFFRGDHEMSREAGFVFSYGHRNPQGLTWDDRGQLWSTEHGRSGVSSGLDELNLIIAGKNYGWPDSQGDLVLAGTVGPVEHSGPDVTWAPGDALYWDGSIFFPGLRGETLYEAVLNSARTDAVEVREHLAGEFGRLRTVVLGKDGMMYLTTSNRDGRGDAQAGDDKIIRIDPRMFR